MSSQAPSDLLSILRDALAKLGVPSVSRERANRVVQEVPKELIKYLQRTQPLVCRPEYPGSSHEGTKIDSADEFDILLILDGRGLKTVPCNTPFFALRPERKDDDRYREYLTDQGYIDPSKIISKVTSWGQRWINTSASPYTLQITINGPAVTLNISSGEFGRIDVDLVPAFEIDGTHYVAKPCKISGQLHTVPKDAYWHKSLSLEEKNALKSIDNDGGYRRQCLRLFKAMRIRDSQLKYLASYHYKLLLLNEAKKLPRTQDWTQEKLADRFWGMLLSLEKYLSERKLPHAIEPRINTFESRDDMSLTELSNRIRRLRAKGSAEINSILQRQPLN